LFTKEKRARKGGSPSRKTAESPGHCTGFEEQVYVDELEAATARPLLPCSLLCLRLSFKLRRNLGEHRSTFDSRRVEGLRIEAQGL
jgi:hypothetical protein